MPLLVFLMFSPPVWVTLGIILLLGVGAVHLAQVHPSDPHRALAPVQPRGDGALGAARRAGRSGRASSPPEPVKWGLLAASLWLLLAGIVMQLLPAREPEPEPAPAQAE